MSLGWRWQDGCSEADEASVLAVGSEHTHVKAKVLLLLREPGRGLWNPAQSSLERLYTPQFTFYLDSQTIIIIL